MEPSRVKRTLKRLFFLGVVLLLLGLFSYAFRAQLLTGLARVLIVNDPLQPADIIFILNGDVNTRPFFAAELFKQELAPQIVLAREEDGPAAEIGLYPNGTDVTVEVMTKLGVPDDRITVIPIQGGATSTRDEAVILRRYVDEHQIRRVLVVTSAFHTRRTRWIIEKELSGSSTNFSMAAAPQWQFDETNWWQEERGLLMFVNEYLKLFYYFAAY
jgi:uncharacterized SAM-binding protein YcdF (DUF218 family)